MVSQGKTTSLALNEEKELTDLAAKHRLKIFSVAIPKQPQVGAKPLVFILKVYEQRQQPGGTLSQPIDHL